MDLLKLIYKPINIWRNFLKANIYNNNLYRIIDVNKQDIYTLQCINTKSIFEATILEIIYNLNLLSGLSSTQSCYIGIEYSNYLKNHSDNQYNGYKNHSFEDINPGYQYKILYQDRDGNICYLDKYTNEVNIKGPHEIVLLDNIINKFNSLEAFYIGMCVGSKSRNKSTNIVKLNLKDKI